MLGLGFHLLPLLPPLQAALIIIVNLPGSISRGGAKFNVGPSKAMKSSSSSSSAEFIGCARWPAPSSRIFPSSSPPGFIPGVAIGGRTPCSKLKWTLSCLVSLAAEAPAVVFHAY